VSGGSGCPESRLAIREHRHMNPDYADLHEDLRAVAREILEPASPLVATGAPPGAIDSRVMADAGWLGLEIPEPMDGAGATFAEVAVVLHEMGRTVARSSYLGSAVLGVGALRLVEPGADRDDLLRQLASGAARVAVVLPTGDEAFGPAALPLSLRPGTGGGTLHGRADFVPDAGGAEWLLVLADAPGLGPVLVSVKAGCRGLQISEQPVIDITQRLASVVANSVAVDDSRVWRFAASPEESARQLVDRGALATACDSLGLAEAMMHATVAYAGVRQQFGRPIGSFQAVKHACADMLVQLTVGRELVEGAVHAVVAADNAEVAVSQAKSHVCESAVDIAGKAMQLHGGIGYTWESGIHFYLKRAALNRSLFGSPLAHRKRLGARFG
jgi:alkylation response protein AidB-like acyl-CoA dehydrogenase